ncbi:uncharacterized protein TNIN_56231 [Trichonephila inaurata madagascariensis]|uniref:Uncharacterized protein n=1 Tax=Trichonephila inaurata madagascariensis TaxID=2747483 RepID=A0A8X7CT12_9ARAC|nr:uncharacterized protein TNIN_56231 [Trichonephila inaurata madagascariensis]
MTGEGTAVIKEPVSATRMTKKIGIGVTPFFFLDPSSQATRMTGEGGANPESGVIKPMIVFVNTDLPLPEPPSMTNDSPFNISKLRSFSTVLSSKDKFKFDIDIMGLRMYQSNHVVC